MECDCKICIYYDAKNDMCDGFTYKCECLKAFCPMFKTEEMIKRHEEFMKRSKCGVLKQENAMDEILRAKEETSPDIDVDINFNSKDKIISIIDKTYKNRKDK